MSSIYNDQNRKNSKYLNLKILLKVKVQNINRITELRKETFTF